MTDKKNDLDLGKFLPPLQLIPIVMIEAMFKTAKFTAQMALISKGSNHVLEASFNPQEIRMKPLGEGCRIFLKALDNLNIEVEAVLRGIL